MEDLEDLALLAVLSFAAYWLTRGGKGSGAGAAAQPAEGAMLNLRDASGKVDPSLAQVLSDLCDTYQVPYGVAAGWILAESNGKLGSSGLASLDERGYFQVSAEESAHAGIDDHARLSTDPAYSLEGGLKLITYYRGQILALTGSVNDGSEYLFRLCKLWHGAGSGAGKLTLEDAADRGITDWRAFAQSERSTHIAGHSAGYMGTWIDQVDKVFTLGAAYGALSLDDVEANA